MTTGVSGILVRAAVNLSGLPVGETTRVDPDDPYIAELLDGKYLVREEDEDDAPAGVDAGAAEDEP